MLQLASEHKHEGDSVKMLLRSTYNANAADVVCEKALVWGQQQHFLVVLLLACGLQNNTT